MIDGPVRPPHAGGTPKQLVVLLHGYGADGQDLIGLGEYWGPRLPDALFAAPDAPSRCAQNPFGYEWFPLDFEQMVESVRTGVPAAQAVVESYLMDLFERTGLGPRDTMLVGFSQGAMLALHLGLSLKTQLAGIVSFSGALMPPEGFAAGARPKPPVCLVHGDLDQVVDPALTQQAATILAAHGYEVSVHFSRGMAHGISPDGLEFATAFMLPRLGAASV